MERSANFIPLGQRPAAAEGDGENLSVHSRVKVIGKSKEERKEIARQVRLAAKKEKKKIKADAKRQRKQNAVMHRRATRNSEKYSKNKERNKQRAIDLERQRIRHNAVRQAEQLAGRYDMTGKLFNVGEVVIMPDGQVKSKETLAKAEEAKRKREEEKAEEEVWRKKKEDFKAARRAAHASTMKGEIIPDDILNRAFYDMHPRPHKISKKQQQRQEMLAPKPVLPKPVIPEGYSIPAGEENFLALWDITDQEIQKRLGEQKREKKMAAKRLRRVQKEAKKFNRAMKVKKKMAANAGILWDPERAKKEILAQANGLTREEGDSNSYSDADSDSDSDSDSGSDSGSDSNGYKVTKNGKHEVSIMSDAPSGNDSGIKSDANTSKKKKMGKFPGVRLNLELLAEAERIEKARQDKKKEARDQRRAARKAAATAAEKAVEEAKIAERAARKAAKLAAKQAVTEEADKSSPTKKRKHAEDGEETSLKRSHKKVKSEQPEAAPEATVVKDEVDLIGAVEKQLVDEDRAERKKKKKSRPWTGADIIPEGPVAEERSEGKKKKKRKHSEENGVEHPDKENSEKKKKKSKASDGSEIS